MFAARTLFAAFVVMIASLAITPEIIRADSPSTTAVTRAKTFLDKRATGDMILTSAHFGTTYKSHTFQGIRSVTDRAGNPLPGQFALVYRFKWEASDIGTTDLGFICDAKGGIEEVVAISSDGVLQQPFLVADATIQVVGQLVIEMFKDNASSEEIARAKRFVTAADSRGLLGFSLGLKQALGN